VGAVPWIPAQGPAILVAQATVLGDDAGGRAAAYVVDAETGATSRITSVDPSCAPLAQYWPGPGGAAVPSGLPGLRAFSPSALRFFGEPVDVTDVPIMSMTVEGRCAALWHEPSEFTGHPSFSADGSKVFRMRDHALEVRPTDGGAAKELAWVDFAKYRSELAVSPHADRIALAEVSGDAGPSTVVTCDLAGACVPAFSAPRAWVFMAWSPDGARLACLTKWPDSSVGVSVVAIASPSAPPVEIHPATKRPNGKIDEVAWSPDGARLALLSSHEGGCSAGVQDIAGGCRQAVYVVGADGTGLRLVRDGLSGTGLFWVR
jgi:Tol biopolymer transport system component